MKYSELGRLSLFYIYIHCLKGIHRFFNLKAGAFKKKMGLYIVGHCEISLVPCWQVYQEQVPVPAHVALLPQLLAPLHVRPPGGGGPSHHTGQCHAAAAVLTQPLVHYQLSVSSSVVNICNKHTLIIGCNFLTSQFPPSIAPKTSTISSNILATSILALSGSLFWLPAAHWISNTIIL